MAVPNDPDPAGGGQFQTVGTSKSRQTNHNASQGRYPYIHASRCLAVTLWWTFTGSAVEGYIEEIKRGFYRLRTVKRAHDGSFVLLLRSTDQLLLFIKINNVATTYRQPISFAEWNVQGLMSQNCNPSKRCIVSCPCKVVCSILQQASKGVQSLWNRDKAVGKSKARIGRR